MHAKIPMSEAMMLGRSMMKELSNFFWLKDGCTGCAVGCALVGVNRKESKSDEILLELWPWVVHSSYPMPYVKCSHIGCGGYETADHFHTDTVFGLWITREFDAVLDKEQTFEQLVDKVRALEQQYDDYDYSQSQPEVAEEEVCVECT